MKKTEAAKNFIAEIVIFALSILFFAIYNYSNINSPLVDDNVFQWEPIIEKAFAGIFEGGGIPYYNFYEFKGLDIFSTGYYGQLNPFMYLAYAVSRYLFSFDVKVLTVYIVIMYGLGNIMMHKLLTELKISVPVKAVMQLVYATSLFFFMYEFYYFTFNSYFFVPFFVLIMYRVRDTKYEWFVPGIILAASMLLGHVQYSSYYIIAFCVIQCVSAVQKKNVKPVLQMFAGIGIFAVTNGAYMLSMLSGSSNRELSGISRSEFFSDNVKPMAIYKLIDIVRNPAYINDRVDFQEHIGLGILPVLCFSIIFNEKIFEMVDELFERFYSYNFKREEAEAAKSKRVILIAYIASVLLFTAVVFCFMDKDPFSIISMVCYAALAAAMVVFMTKRIQSGGDDGNLGLKKLFYTALAVTSVIMMFAFNIVLIVAAVLYSLVFLGKKREKIDCPDKDKFIHTLCFAALFFMIFGAGEEQLLTQALSFIPVFNRFRYLYKCAYIYIPLMVTIAAFLLDKYKNSEGVMKKAAVPLLVVMVLNSGLSVTNILYVVNSGEHGYINNPTFDYYDVDGDKAAVEKRMSELGIDKNYRFLALSDDNMPTIESASAMCSYNMAKNFQTAFSVFTLAGYDSVCSWEGYEQSDHILVNVASEYNMSGIGSMEMIDRLSNTEDHEYSSVLHDQFVRNGVRYIIYPGDVEEYYTSMISFADRFDDISVIRNESWLKGYMIMELEGTYPVCRNENNEKIDLNTRIDEISFDTEFDAPETVTLSLTYNENIFIEASDENGSTEIIKPVPDEYGYLCAAVPGGKHTVKITYKSRIKDAAVVFACLSFILAIAAVTVVGIAKRKEQ